MLAELQAELKALDLWDRLYAESVNPSQIEQDAAKARFFRRVQVSMELLALTEGGSALVH